MFSIIALGCNLITAECSVVTHRPNLQFNTFDVCEVEANKLDRYLSLTKPNDFAVKVKCVSWADGPNV